jgi:hypothetical protein
MTKITEIRLGKKIALAIFLVIGCITVAGYSYHISHLSNYVGTSIEILPDTVDTTCPIVTAAFIPNHMKKTQGIFEIDYQATDDIDPDPQITAIFNISWPVDEWTIILKEGDSDIKITIDYDDCDTTIKGQSPSVILEHIKVFGGLKVSDGQKWKIELDLKDDEVVIKLDEDESYSLYDPTTDSYVEYEEVKIEIENEESNPFLMIENLLYVMAIDDSGNIGFAYATPPFDTHETIEEQTTTLDSSTDETSSSSSWSIPEDSTIPSGIDTDDLTPGFEYVSVIVFIGAFMLYRRRKKPKN